MREWNGTCEQFAVEKRRLIEQHKMEEFRDHTLRSLNTQPIAFKATRLNDPGY